MKYTHAMPRRTFLRGLGATMALPLLDSMAPAASVSAASAPPIRLGYVYTPNGIVGACDKSPRPFMWTPKGTGANFEFSPTMKALEPFRDDVNVFSGLAQVTGRALGDGPGDHARATATFLTRTIASKVSGDGLDFSASSLSFASKNVSTGKTVTASGIALTGTDKDNYALSSTTAANTADITARALTLSATGVNKTYDGTTAATVTLSDNRVPGDVFTRGYTSATFANKNVARPSADTGPRISDPWHTGSISAASCVTSDHVAPPSLLVATARPSFPAPFTP